MSGSSPDVEAACSRRAVLRALGAVAVLGGTATCRRSSAPAPAPAPTATFPAPDVEPIVRVRILRQHTAAPPLRIDAADRWLELAPFDDVAPGPRAVLRAPVTIERDALGWQLRDGEGFRAGRDGTAPLRLAVMPDGGGLALDGPGALGIDGLEYPGDLRFVPRSDGGFDVVNHVALEAYLPGVLDQELFGHWHDETYIAQAVAARSFACSEHRNSAKRAYDLTNTQRSQAYVGHATEPKATDAVRRTRGLVLTYGPDLVPGYYSSCCGGAPATGPDAIGPHPANALPPLLGRPEYDECRNASVFAWTAERDATQSQRRLRAYAQSRKLDALAEVCDADALTRIELTTTNARGRPTAYRVRGIDGSTAVVGAEALRRGLDYAGDGLPAPKDPLKSSFLEIRIEDGRLLIAGAGFGHGVGLCQYGAEAMAAAGKDWRTILAWYYPGAAVTRAYL